MKLMSRFVRGLGLAFGVALGCAACHAGAEVHASTNEGVNAKGEAKDDSFTVTEGNTPPPASSGAPAAPPPSAAPAPAAPTAPPAGTCPLHCYAASGADRILIGANETAQIGAAIEPALSKMRACVPAETWRRHGSPVIHLRVEPDGVVHEVDVDPHHVYEGEAECIDDSARTTAIALSLPGRKTVRCDERCVPEAKSVRRRR